MNARDAGVRITVLAVQKDLALAGAALMLLALIAHTGSDLGLTITGPLFDIG
jgi:putative oxidoreductase